MTLTTAEAAVALGVTADYVSRLVAAGRLVPAVRGARGRGNTHRFHPADVRRLREVFDAERCPTCGRQRRSAKD